MSEILTINDSRTNKEYKIEIHDGNIRAKDLRQIKVNEDCFLHFLPNEFYDIEDILSSN